MASEVASPWLYSTGSIVEALRVRCSKAFGIFSGQGSPRSWIQPMSPALATVFFTIDPPGKPLLIYFTHTSLCLLIPSTSTANLQLVLYIFESALLYYRHLFVGF